MPKLPRITAEELLRALRKNGWREVRQRGGHVQLKHPIKAGLATVPRHSGEILKPYILSSILDQAGLTADELRRLL